MGFLEPILHRQGGTTKFGGESKFIPGFSYRGVGAPTLALYKDKPYTTVNIAELLSIMPQSP